MRFKVGACISVVWLTIMIMVAVVTYSPVQPMKPNEWGDFFAGFFAPLAFLWLVLGYLQQGDELQLSTKALQLQAEELKNSVEQQRELVEVTRKQLAGELEALDLERRARQEAAKPLFVVSNRGGSFSHPNCTWDITVHNAGNTVTQVRGSIQGPGMEPIVLFEDPMFARSSSGSVKLARNEPLPDKSVFLTINYVDVYGQSGRCLYAVEKQTSEPNSMLTFIFVEG